MDSKNVDFSTSSNDNSVDFKQIIEQYLFYWKWILLSVVIFVVASTIYLRYSIPIYNVSAKVLIVDDKSSSELSGLAELSLISGGPTSSISDQIDVIKSRRLLRKVVESAQLNHSYFVVGKIRKDEVTEKDLPFKILYLDSANFNVTQAQILPIKAMNDKVILSINGKDLEVAYGEPVNTVLGSISFSKVLDNITETKYELVVSPVDAIVSDLLGAISVVPKGGGQTNVLIFSIAHRNISKGGLILNTLIDQYNFDVKEDKIRLSQGTSDFINARLEVVSKDLKLADSNLASFKNENKTLDMASEGELYFQNSSTNDLKLAEYEVQFRLAQLMSNNINDKFTLLPSNIGITEPSIDLNVQKYNTMVLEREDLLKSATLDNPVIKNIDRNLLELKSNIVASLGNYIKILNTNVNSIKEQKGISEIELRRIPTKEMGFKELSRQQQIIESLYLFLLEKREENEIKSSVIPTNVKVVDYAEGGVLLSPNKQMITIAAFVLGLFLPIGILFLKFFLDNKVQSRKDVEAFFNVPILGEVPSSEDPIIKDNDRSSLAEAFRILRTNIAFMLGAKKDKSSILFVTSTTSGEGKSFVSTNLARILSMSGKRVLLLGADIRSPKVLDYLGLSHLQHTNIGITQYLINPDMDIDNIIIKKPDPYNFDIIYSGYVAPNPAELLMNGYFENIINYGRDNYDYVIVDTAPVGLVTDTLLISDQADLTIYVTRANYLEKRMLNVAKELYETGKLKNMAVVVNDIDFARGYGYGYGYGYGDSDKHKSLISRIMRCVGKFFSTKEN